jgi:hypothetical protein
VSADRYKPHLLVLPEDDANRELASGFLKALDLDKARQLRVLPVAGGWESVLNQFSSDWAPRMDSNGNRFMVLLIDFDGKNDRLSRAKEFIPARLADRVFVLGVWTEPEDFKGGRPYETIGKDLARDCREGTEKLWGHELLRHNAGEVDRLRTFVRPFLF